MLKQERLKELLNYNKSTGVFTRAKTITGNAVVGMVAGSLKKNGYVHIQIDGKCYLAHRLAWLYEYGTFPDGILDHINGNRCDNRIENIREVTSMQNCQNEMKRTNNTSGVKVVCWDKRKGNWIAKIGFMHKTIYVGNFSNIEDAKEAIMKKREELHGEYVNHGLCDANYPTEKRNRAAKLRKGAAL